MVDIKKLQSKLFQAMDNNNNYSMDDFNKEYSDIINQQNIGSNNVSYKSNINFVNKSNNADPEYATEGSAGFDFRANITESLVIPGKMNDNNIVIVPTGLYFQLPINSELQVRPRSGLAAKHGITVLNSPGTVDSDYRGEVKIILINHKNEDFTINPGDRIAQGIIAPVNGDNIVNLNKVTQLNDNTDRGENGFGSTGLK